MDILSSLCICSPCQLTFLRCGLPSASAAFPGLTLRLGSSLQIPKDKLHSMHILPLKAASGVGHLQTKTQTQPTNMENQKQIQALEHPDLFAWGRTSRQLNKDQNQSRASRSNGGKQDTTLLLPKTPDLKIAALQFIGKLLVIIFLALRSLLRE